MSLILIVDDEETIRNLIAEVLYLKHECHAVTNVEDALALLKQREFDVVLTDISLPGQSGVELLGFVRQHQPETPVILISGIHDPAYAQGLIEMGAFGYLSKPFGVGEIEATVERALESRWRRSHDAQERRVARRYNTQVSARLGGVLVFDSEDEEGMTMISGMTRDISETGLAMIVPRGSFDERTIIGTSFHIVLELPEDALDVEATAVRCQDFGIESALIGAQITNMSGRDRVMMMSYLLTLGGDE